MNKEDDMEAFNVLFVVLLLLNLIATVTSLIVNRRHDRNVDD